MLGFTIEIMEFSFTYNYWEIDGAWDLPKMRERNENIISWLLKFGIFFWIKQIKIV